jgi:hypothetical protein
MLRKVGLLRLNRGVLAPTRAAADDLEIIRRLRTWFEPDGFEDILAGDTVAILASEPGPLSPTELARRLHPLVDDRWSLDGRPLTTTDVEHAFYRLSAALRALDLGRGRLAGVASGPLSADVAPPGDGSRGPLVTDSGMVTPVDRREWAAAW